MSAKPSGCSLLYNVFRCGLKSVHYRLEYVALDRANCLPVPKIAY